MNCPLCLNRRGIYEVESKDKRNYFLCNHCSLIFTDTRHFSNQKRLQKENKINKTVFQHVEQLMAGYLKEGMQGIIYSFQDSISLTDILSSHEISCKVEVYSSVPEDILVPAKYDFIIALFVLEQYFLPAKEILALTNLLREDGYLFVFTEKWGKIGDFNKWSYKRNSLNVSFFHEKSFEYISQRFAFQVLHFSDNPLVILKKIAFEPTNEQMINQQNSVKTRLHLSYYDY